MTTGKNRQGVGGSVNTNAQHKRKQSATEMFSITLPRMRQHREMQVLRSINLLKYAHTVNVKSSWISLFIIKLNSPLAWLSGILALSDIFANDAACAFTHHRTPTSVMLNLFIGSHAQQTFDTDCALKVPAAALHFCKATLTRWTNLISFQQFQNYFSLEHSQTNERMRNITHTKPVIKAT